MDPSELRPFNFKEWIDKNRHLLKPPVGATLLFKDCGFIIMVVGGPNTRSDYHINQTEEFFYQLEGDMILKVHHNDQFKDIPIKEGEVFLLPARVPHSPQRFSNTVGLVIEKQRLPGQLDTLRWYCDNTACRAIVYEETFQLEDLDLGKALAVIINKFYGSVDLRTCKKCGHLCIPPTARAQPSSM